VPVATSMHDASMSAQVLIKRIESKSRVCSFYPAGTKRGRRQLSLICGLLNLQRAGLIDPIDASLDDAYKPSSLCEPSRTSSRLWSSGLR
jgi:hypothetical protein